jgi:hypothetical protein
MNRILAVFFLYILYILSILGVGTICTFTRPCHCERSEAISLQSVEIASSLRSSQ